MRLEQEPPSLIVCSDFDGVITKGPPPIFSVAFHNRHNGQLGHVMFTGKSETFAEKAGVEIARLTLSLRPVKPEATRWANRLYEEGIPLILLTGRPESYAFQTCSQLRQSSVLECFSGFAFKPKGTSPWEHKQETIRSLLEDGHTVIHLEDDPVAASLIGRLDQDKVTVILWSTISSHETLLRSKKIELSENVIKTNNPDFLENLVTIIQTWQNSSLHLSFSRFIRQKEVSISPII